MALTDRKDLNLTKKVSFFVWTAETRSTKLTFRIVPRVGVGVGAGVGVDQKPGVGVGVRVGVGPGLPRLRTPYFKHKLL